MCDAVSVPLRGKGRDQRASRQKPHSGLCRFPSPCGEKVGINFVFGDYYEYLAYCTFPSPCGEKVGINPNDSQGHCCHSFREFPSPCGEKVGINNLAEVKINGFSLKEAFPSPCGEKVGINRTSLSAEAYALLRFRPLAGKR